MAIQPATLRRHIDRALYSEDAVTSVFADSHFAYVAYVDEDGFPQCLPMVAIFRSFGEEQAAIYLHGHPTAKLMELVKQQEAKGAGDHEDGAGVDKIKVCVTSTKVDGIVLSSAPNGHTFNYRSAVVHGTCTRVTNREQKLQVMKAVMEHNAPSRWNEINPVASIAMGLVTVIRVDVTKASVKVRTGDPVIQPRNLEKDGPSQSGPVWSGMIPIFDCFDEPIPSAESETIQAPESIRRLVRDSNERRRMHALSANADQTYH